MTGVRIFRPSVTRGLWSSMLLLAWAGFFSVRVGAESARVGSSAAPESHPDGTKNGDDFWWADRFDPVRFTNRSSSYYFGGDPHRDAAAPSYVFFPPVPPPLDADYPVLGALVPGSPPAPPELSAFVNELFYPQIGARLLANDFPKELWQQVQAYRGAKTALQDELRSRIAASRETDLQTRERELAVFAASQSPRILRLEEVAEKIRAELQPTRPIGFLAEGATGTQERERPNPSLQSDTPDLQELRLESEILRHAAYWEKDLSVAQRHLLREAAIELESRAAPRPSKAAPEARVLYFSPESARISLPLQLADPVEKSISDYVTTKNSLKAELRAALLREETNADSRAQTLKRLAESQASRFSAIEAMAEAIRRSLAMLPNPPGPPASPDLPPPLLARVSTYRLHKQEVLRTLHGLLAGVRENVNPTTGRVNGPINSPASTSQAQNRTPSLQESIADFNRKQTILVAELNQERLEIREALAEYVRTTGRADDRKTIDDLLKDFENARQRQELLEKFRDYQTAVLMPGLSPEQRRLLFDGAVEQLALPLPCGRKAP